MLIVLDTNVVSELTKPVPSAAVVAWISGQPPDNLFTTTITMAEILYGVEILPKGRRREALLREAEATFEQDFAGRILPFDEPAAHFFAIIAATRRAHGKPISISDVQIAAISRASEATLATRNVDDFGDCGVKLINPWT
jgi:predicted nucleic acid-binding protein